MPTQDKRRRLLDPASGAQLEPQTEVDKSGAGEIANVARLAALERFRSHNIKMPWEKGPLAPIFGFDTPGLSSSSSLVMPVFGMADTLAPSASVKQDTPPPVETLYKFAMKRIASAKFVIQEDELLSRCLNQIKTMMLMDLHGTEIGTAMSNLAGGLDESADLLQVLKDCFARKATATILKRTSSMLTLAGWLLEGSLCHLRDSGAAPSKASHVLEAVNFFNSILRYRNINIKDLMSSRVTGAAHSMFLNKRKLLQAPQLTVAAARALEKACVAEANLLQTVVCRTLLFCIFASARWSDLVRIEQLFVDIFEDVTMIEGVTSRHKTSRTKEAKTRLLPFTALGRFWDRKSWGLVFVDAWDKIRDQTQCAFLPAWNDRSGTWSTSPMTTAEASCFLKEYLAAYLGEHEAVKYSTHSCKPTLLTWVAMTEHLTQEERTLMGHHMEASTKSATTYNRDALLIIHAKVAKVLEMIRQGELKPDASGLKG
eukprot:s1362_g11.t1